MQLHCNWEKSTSEKIKPQEMKKLQRNIASKEGTKPMVLAVEDDIDHQKLLSFYLLDYYEISYATSVREAIDYLKKYPLAIVLLDLSLIGRESGLDLCRYMRQSKRWKDTPIIVITSHAFPRDREICLDAGCNDYLVKPIKKDELLEMIARYLD